jgi:hypothetical protein
MMLKSDNLIIPYYSPISSKGGKRYRNKHRTKKHKSKKYKSKKNITKKYN